MKNLIKSIINYFIYIIPELLILILFITFWSYRHNIYDLSVISYYGFIIILTFFVILLIYDKLYQQLKLEQSVSSFIFFTVNIMQLYLYLYAISALFMMYYHNSFKSIFLKDLSILSQYRYLVLSLCSLVFLSIFLIFRIFKFNFSCSSNLTYPYLKEEIRKILYSWNDAFLGDFCAKLIDILASSMFFRISFYLLHFIVFYFARLLTAILLFYCVFYQGDFSYFLIILPFMFFIWLLSFFNYYFIYFQQACNNYICSLISASLSHKEIYVFNLVKLDPSSQILFKLTEEALSKGYTTLDINHLAKEWYIQAQLSSYFDLYLKITKYINYFIFLLQLISWCYITELFFQPF